MAVPRCWPWVSGEAQPQGAQATLRLAGASLQLAYGKVPGTQVVAMRAGFRGLPASGEAWLLSDERPVCLP